MSVAFVLAASEPELNPTVLDMVFFVGMIIDADTDAGSVASVDFCVRVVAEVTVEVKT